MKQLRLGIERSVRASVQRCFLAWTDPATLQAWWGPDGVTCTHVEIDARVGGRYRIANQLASGEVIWISGEYIEVVPLTRLVFTWSVGDGDALPEIVTVLFEGSGDSTTIRIVHERIASPEKHGEHARGWQGCLDGLERWALR